ncbi:4'-phosphopantetheinyl transferase family protein [Priestia aryabhattai]|uniref:4'-phosphopantetheinyl transferase family protein n=1 Tax=Priestia aryabhattai TaxID=412384 RepID=UPI001CFD2D37|nr:4'-phosphopantetheinyl transferase superfamily protein [Priestia aryabhattai]
MQILYCRSEEFSHESLYKMKKYLSPEKQARIEKIRRIEDIKSTIISELLIRMFIKKIYNEKTTISYTEFNKPYLLTHPNIHYNVSHSGNYIICGVDNCSIGVDIELIENNIESNLDIAKHFFNKDEYNYLLGSPEYRQNELFYELWTLKESFIKLLGEGLHVDLNSFNIHMEKCIKVKSDLNMPFYFRLYELDEKYKMAVCSTNNIFPDELIKVSAEELVEFF